MFGRLKQYVILGGSLYLFQTDPVQTVLKSEKLFPALGILVFCLLSFALYLTIKIKKRGQNE